MEVVCYVNRVSFLNFFLKKRKRETTREMEDEGIKV